MAKPEELLAWLGAQDTKKPAKTPEQASKSEEKKNNRIKLEAIIRTLPAEARAKAEMLLSSSKKGPQIARHDQIAMQVKEEGSAVASATDFKLIIGRAIKAHFKKKVLLDVDVVVGGDGILIKTKGRE